MATLNKIAADLNETSRANEGAGFHGDWAGCFDLSSAQATRIAEKATDGAEFVRIWENEDWWV